MGVDGWLTEWVWVGGVWMGVCGWVCLDGWLIGGWCTDGCRWMADWMGWWYMDGCGLVDGWLTKWMGVAGLVDG